MVDQVGNGSVRKKILEARGKVFDAVTGVTNNPLNRSRPEVDPVTGEPPKMPVVLGLGLMPAGGEGESQSDAAAKQAKKGVLPGLITQ